MKEIIHFAHGNGFPSSTYHQLLKHLNDEYDCCFIDRVGHNQDFPVTENWHALAKEVVDSVQSQAPKPVIALGHSLGGVLSFLAAIEKPSLFKAVILLDSPIIGRFKSHALRLSKSLGLIDHITPAHRTKGRRRHWKTREEAWNYLKSKKLFKTFTDACLEDYIDYGLKKDDSGYSLRFDPNIEYQIYRTIPHVLHELEGKLKLPTALIYGNKSKVIEQSDVRYMENKHGMISYKTKGTHMFPLEHPEDTAKLIKQVIEKLL